MSQYTYALIDGVMRQTAIKDLYSRKEAIQTIPLYINTRYKDNYDLGPILVAALEGSNLITDIKQNWVTSATLIQSDQYLQTIADHLKQLITVTDESGTQSLFRFADPLSTYYWLNSYPQNALPDIMGPISHWQIAIPCHSWQQPMTQWQTITNPNTPPLGFTINHLEETQENALQQAADFRYLDKICQWLKTQNPKALANKTEDQITQWLEQTHQNAKANNLTTELSIALYIDLCADYGQDFISQEGGQYQQWLTNNTSQKSLPIDLKIENYHQHING